MLSWQKEKILAEEIITYPCLYGKNKNSYHERDVARNAWEKVTEHLTFAENDKHNLF